MNLPERRREQIRLSVYLGILTALAVFYAAISYCSHQTFTWPNGGWYGELARALSRGQVSMLSQPSPELLADPHPYSGQHSYPYKWDVSFYHGKYYLYFGPAPAVLFFLPWQLLTGHTLNQALVYWFLCVVGLILFALFVAAAVRLYRPTTPIGLQAFLLVLFGLGLEQGFCMHLVLVYELAAMTGAVFVLAMFYFLFLGLHSKRRALGWSVAAGTCWALAVASRPTLIALGIVFVPIVFWLFKEQPLARVLAGVAALVTLPACIGGLLAWYNYLRFGHVLDFGVDYQIASYNYQSQPRFSVAFFPSGLLNILLRLPRPSLDFPFLFATSPPTQCFLNPRNFSSPCIGILFLLPILFYGSYAPRLIKGRLKAFANLTLSVGCVMFGLVASYFSLGCRYYLDFLPPFFLLLAVTLVVAGVPPRAKSWARGIFFAAAGWSLWMGLALALAGETNGIHTFNTYPLPAAGSLWLPDGEFAEPWK